MFQMLPTFSFQMSSLLIAGRRGGYYKAAKAVCRNLAKKE